MVYNYDYSIDKTQQHEPRVTPNEKVDEWLPWVHIAIGNLKTFFVGYFSWRYGQILTRILE